MGRVPRCAVSLALGCGRQHQIAYQETRNQNLTPKFNLLDQEVAEIRDLQLKRNRLIDRMRVIQALQGNRPVIVRLLDQLVRTVPEGVFYTSLQTDAQSYRLRALLNPTTGSPVSCAAWRRQLAQAPSLDAVQATPDYGTQATHFTLSVGIELPEEAVEQPL